MAPSPGKGINITGMQNAEVAEVHCAAHMLPPDCQLLGNGEHAKWQVKALQCTQLAK